MSACGFFYFHEDPEYDSWEIKNPEGWQPLGGYDDELGLRT